MTTESISVDEQVEFLNNLFRPVPQRQQLTLEQALSLAYRLCESRMRREGEMWFCGEEVRRDIADLIASIQVVESLPSPR